MQLVGESTVAALSRDAVARPVREFRPSGLGRVVYSTRTRRFRPVLGSIGRVKTR
jgi:hypothetical protein